MWRICNPHCILNITSHRTYLFFGCPASSFCRPLHVKTPLPPARFQQQVPPHIYACKNTRQLHPPPHSYPALTPISLRGQLHQDLLSSKSHYKTAPPPSEPIPTPSPDEGRNWVLKGGVTLHQGGGSHVRLSLGFRCGVLSFFWGGASSF